MLLFASLAPSSAVAQPWGVNDQRGVVEAGVAQEWFHRELEPELYSDTRWSVTSFTLNYNAFDWLNLGFEGGLSEFESDDFPGSEYERYSVGGTLGARLYRRGNWSIAANARYLDTFDMDHSENLLHKRVRSIGGSVNAVREFAPLGRTLNLWAGPAIAHDLVETFFWDSLDATESTSGVALGVSAGARALIHWIALYGFVSYIDDWQGGIGVSLHADGGGF
jgi:hypothetical protein